VLASHVTGGVATVRLLAAETAAQVVDAPVSGTADDIEAGQLTVMLGGEDSAIDACRSVMSAYAKELLGVGELGSALAVKLVNNLLFAAHAQLAVEAVSLGRQLGVAQETLLGALSVCSGQSYAVTTLRKVPDVAAFSAAAGPFLRKDIAACEQELAASGATAELLLDVVRRGSLALH
jgi:3-hydroxyisobutyrate dehydrogenase-like beta-hydroxyacid dehydrogenase